jgi:hypothetical protein
MDCNNMTTTSTDELRDDQLDKVTGGLTFVFKLVAVKTISWAHDDEAPKN